MQMVNLGHFQSNFSSEGTKFNENLKIAKTSSNFKLQSLKHWPDILERN